MIREGRINTSRSLHGLHTTHKPPLHSVSLQQPDSAVSCFSPSKDCSWKDCRFMLHCLHSEMLPLESNHLQHPWLCFTHKDTDNFRKKCLQYIYWCSIFASRKPTGSEYSVKNTKIPKPNFSAVSDSFVSLNLQEQESNLIESVSIGKGGVLLIEGAHFS